MIVRAHECVMDGFERFAQGHLITLFSATNYCGTAGNAGAILVLGRDLVMVRGRAAAGRLGGGRRAAGRAAAAGRWRGWWRAAGGWEVAGWRRAGAAGGAAGGGWEVAGRRLVAAWAGGCGGWEVARLVAGWWRLGGERLAARLLAAVAAGRRLGGRLGGGAAAAGAWDEMDWGLAAADVGLGWDGGVPPLRRCAAATHRSLPPPLAAPRAQVPKLIHPLPPSTPRTPDSATALDEDPPAHSGRWAPR
jgi:hypothetical protein